MAVVIIFLIFQNVQKAMWPSEKLCSILFQNNVFLWLWKV